MDLVDRYWNGTKSLHKNYKFLGAANQLLSQHLEASPVDESHLKTLQMHIKNLQDENRSLQQTMMEKLSNYHHHQQQNGKTSEQQQHDTKSWLAEMDTLKKKLIVVQEENKRLKSELAAKASANQMEGQNDLMKRDIEIMRIKLKQYEQLQQLTAMLQGNLSLSILLVNIA